MKRINVWTRTSSSYNLSLSWRWRATANPALRSASSNILLLTQNTKSPFNKPSHLNRALNRFNILARKLQYLCFCGTLLFSSNLLATGTYPDAEAPLNQNIAYAENSAAQELAQELDSLSQASHESATGAIFNAWPLAAPALITLLLLIGYYKFARQKNRFNRKYRRDQELERQLFSKGPVAVLTWLPQDGWPVVFASANVNKVLGVAKKRLLSQDFRFRDIISPEEVPQIKTKIQTSLQNGQNQWQHIYRIRDDQNQTRWINSVTMAEQDEMGQVSCLRGYLLDVTARLALEDRLKLLASVFEHAQEGIAITNAEGKILETNPSFNSITGFSLKEIAGENLRILNADRYSPAFYSNMWKTLAQTGSWEGEIYNRRKNGQIYPGRLSITAVSNEQNEVSHHIAVFTDISDLKQQELKIQQLTHYDALTSLPNRVLLVDHLHMAMAEAYREQKQLAVVCLDLDGFKLVNDTYGHAIGDALLTLIGRRLTTTLEETDTVARLGGDEFVLVLGGSTDRATLLTRLNHILEELNKPCELPKITVSLSASIGITFFPGDDSDPDTLLRHADQAMYRAKQAGRGHYHIFEVHEEWELRQRLDSREQFRKAMDDRELVLYYQPKVDMQQGRVVGVEALVRWQHPERGLLLPGQFLPVIENTELELDFGEWVIATALAQANDWYNQGLTLTVSVNIASPHVLSSRFISYLSSQLENYPRLPSGTLEIELLESAALADLEEVGKVLTNCRKLGIGIALDDFGTGYSSLAHLRSLPADMLKVDQSFVRNMLNNTEDMAIVEGIVGLAQVFHRRIIAEGVETTAHGLMLISMGCKLAQGYIIARPMPAADIAWWIRDWVPEESWLSARSLEPIFPFC